MDKGEGEIPTLVKHLPGWPSVQERALYIVNQDELKRTFANQGVLEAVSFEGGAEAATADYQGPKLVLIEFKTPQLAADNDARIVARIQELRNQGQIVPLAYRRVGNYSVFVFDAQNEQAANQLIDQVQYQQVVQWLGRNPTLYDRAVNEFTRTTLGVFVAVVKASGLVILGSLALGGLFGTVLFRMRRKQQRLAQAYSDAGGMLRLNIDELNATHDPARLIGPGN
jgi:muconolactone delta-isomerase